MRAFRRRIHFLSAERIGDEEATHAQSTLVAARRGRRSLGTRRAARDQLVSPRGAEHHARPLRGQHRRLRVHRARAPRARSRSSRTGSRARCRRTARTSSGSTIGPATTTTSTTTATASPTSAYRFTFDTEVRNPNSFLYAGPGTQDFNDPKLNVIQTYDLVREEYNPKGEAHEQEEDRQQRPGRTAEHRAEDVPELRQLRRPGDEDAGRRHEAVRRLPRRSVLRRPRGHVRRDQRPHGHRQRGRRPRRPVRLLRPRRR